MQGLRIPSCCSVHMKQVSIQEMLGVITAMWLGSHCLLSLVWHLRNYEVLEDRAALLKCSHCLCKCLTHGGKSLITCNWFQYVWLPFAQDPWESLHSLHISECRRLSGHRGPRKWWSHQARKELRSLHGRTPANNEMDRHKRRNTPSLVWSHRDLGDVYS